MGRLSNPPSVVETLADQGWSGPRQSRRTLIGATGGHYSGHQGGSPEERGRLSNPVQHRLSEAEIDELVHRYGKGESIDALALRYEVHRTTVMATLVEQALLGGR